MASLKADDKLIVVRHQPGLQRKLRLMVITALVVVAAVAYSLGTGVANYQHEEALAQLDRLAEHHQVLQDEKRSLQQQVTNLESGRAIDDQAKQQIQATIANLKTELAASQKDLAFYRNIMAPSDNARGLQVQSSELSSTPQQGRYAYKIVLAQVADNKSYVTGVVAVNLIGMRDGKKELLPLRDVSERSDLGIKFRFRYFQNISGELVLPEGFKPEGLQVVAQSKGKKASRVEQSFAWSKIVTKNS